MSRKYFAIMLCVLSVLVAFGLSGSASAGDGGYACFQDDGNNIFWFSFFSYDVIAQNIANVGINGWLYKHTFNECNGTRLRPIAGTATFIYPRNLIVVSLKSTFADFYDSRCGSLDFSMSLNMNTVSGISTAYVEGLKYPFDIWMLPCDAALLYVNSYEGFW